MVRLSQRLNGPPVLRVDSAADVGLDVLADGRGFDRVAFGLVAADAAADAAFVAAATKLQHVAAFAVLDGDAAEAAGKGAAAGGPRVAKLEAGEASVFLDVPSGAGAAAAVEAFVSRHNAPLFNTLDRTNFGRLAHQDGKKCALAVVDFDADGGDAAIAFADRLHAAARALEPRVQETFVFGTLDGVKWAKYLSQFSFGPPLPGLLVVDMDDLSFWHPEDGADVGAFLQAVADGSLAGRQETGLFGLPKRVVEKIKTWGGYAGMILIPIGLLAVSFMTGGEEKAKKA
jgi:hypothetical protein